MKDRNLYYKMNTIFILLLIFPCTGFLYFALKYDFIQDTSVKFFILIGLIYIFVGFTLLRKFFDNIIGITKTITGKIDQDFSAGIVDPGQGELQQLVGSFSALEKQLRQNSTLLARKSSEVSILKELSDLCYVTLDPWEIIHLTLERALRLTNADMGSILILDKAKRPWTFVVRASVGLDDFIKLGDRIDYETSIAKYAVVNKNALLVEDIENDRRFGRSNRIHYGTKSCVMMPLKTINDVIGVINISRGNDDEVFVKADVEALTPLLSNAAFTYENIRLIKELEMERGHVNAIKKVFNTLNSSLQNSELLDTILSETHEIIPYDAAIIMTSNKKADDYVEITNLAAPGGHNLSIGQRFPLNGSLIAKTLQQEAATIIEDLSSLPPGSLDEDLFFDQKLNSLLLAPITTKGGVNGVIMFYSTNSGVFHQCNEITECITNILSFALEENRLSASVLKRNQELVAIKQIGGALASSTFDLKQVLKYTMDMIKTLMNVEAGSLALLKDSELEFSVAFGIDITKLQLFRLKLGQGIAGAVASRGEAIVENDTLDSTHFFSEVDNTTGFRTRSILCVPMISKGKVIGVIEVLNKKEGGFTSDDKDLLQSIASSVSIAMENSRLYEQTMSLAEKERGIRGMFQKFVPKVVIDKIIHGDDTKRTVIDEFKTVTLMNIDIRNFSLLTTEIGPHKSVSLLNSFFSVMGEIVFKHQGIVDKYLGDGFLALFGAPVSSAMDADNAIAAALEMQSAIKTLNEENVKGILNKPLRMGISLYTGEVVVGNIGFEMKMDYTVIGDPVNKVFRLQELTKSSPDCIVISESTCDATRIPLQLKELDAREEGNMKIFELQGKKSPGGLIGWK